MIKFECLTKLVYVLGLPPQHLYYAPPEGHHHPAHSPSSLTKYHENGQDSFSDFVSLVCQDGSGGVPPGPSRSPKVSSYYTPSMYPPPPPMSRPVPLVRPELGGSSTSSPPVSTSPPDHHQHHIPQGYELMAPVGLPPPDPQDGKYYSVLSFDFFKIDSEIIYY